MSDPRRESRADAETFAHRTIVAWLPLLYLLISSLFFLRTYDSAQVKITIMQMGGLGLVTLWLARLAEAGRHAFSRDDLICLSPFIAYLLWGIFSFYHAPYRMASTDFFLRHMFYMSVALIVIYELDEPAVQRLIRVLIWTAWIAIGYGTLQFIDNSAFPQRGIGKGIDPFVWRGAFGDRVFSTYGNPNFYGDFLVIVFPILLTQWLKTMRFSLLPLMLMLLLNLIKTGTKGAWLGFAMVCVFFGAIAFVFFPEQTRPYRGRLLGLVAAGALGFIGYTAKDLATRMVSINFRLFTWEATWEMIRTQPWIGTGIGSFPPIYPAFRRPPIFHIEGKHNTETDHAENEYIEQLFDNGIIGFGLFLWLIISTLTVGFRSLGQLTTSAMLKDGRPPPRAYDLVGLIVSFMGMLGHNNFDVSLRFVSSGVYLGLLSGLIVNVARGKALYELHPRLAPEPTGLPRPEPGAWQTLCEMLIWPARLAAIGGIVYYAFALRETSTLGQPPTHGMFGQFAILMGPLARTMSGGDSLQWWLAWAVFGACMLGLGLAMVRLCLLSQSPAVPLLIAAMLPPLYLFWGYFRADIHHNVAIFFSKERRWEPAVGNYLVVHRLNPDFVMAKYFLGNVFNDRFDMRKVNNPAWGDEPAGGPRDDYERAVHWYNEVRRLAPNYVQMHHQVGNLHFRRAQWAFDQGRPDEAQGYLELALNRYKLYRQVDPVFAPNYARMAQVYMIRKQFDKAAETYRALIDAEKCAVEPTVLANARLRDTILSYQVYGVEDGVLAHRHVAAAWPKDSAEHYTNLGNALFMANRFGEAEQAYRKALSYDPRAEMATKNLQVTYARAQSQGQLRKASVASSTVTPGVPVTTGWEIVPAPKSRL